MPELLRVRVQIGPRLPAHTVAVPAQLVSDSTAEAVLEFGIRSAPCRLTIDSENKSTVQISSGLAERLGIEGEMRVNARWEASRLTLGPLIGIIADTHRRPETLFAEQTRLFQELSEEASKRGALIFFFTPYDINFSQEMIKGYLAPISGTVGSWQTRRFPFPKAVYDRSFYHGAQESTADRIKTRLGSKKGIRFVNSVIGDKWSVHKELSRHAELRPHLPETLLIGKSNELAGLLERHRLVYLKPAHGSQGRGIIRVELKPNGHFTIQHQKKSGEIRRSFSNSATLRAHLKRQFGGRRYLGQQGIELLQHHGALVDLRLIVQKVSENEWSLTGMAARVGRKGSSVTNLHQGGHAIAVPRLLHQHFPSSVKKLTALIERLGCDFAARIERAYGPLGELGIDLGVDRHGQVWYIEANPKPGRRVFILIGAPETRRKTIVRPLEYAMILAGFPPSAARRDQNGSQRD